jgi:hypothetical protein
MAIFLFNKIVNYFSLKTNFLTHSKMILAEYFKRIGEQIPFNFFFIVLANIYSQYFDIFMICVYN